MRVDEYKVGDIVWTYQLGEKVVSCPGRVCQVEIISAARAGEEWPFMCKEVGCPTLAARQKHAAILFGTQVEAEKALAFALHRRLTVYTNRVWDVVSQMEEALK
jgi:hypothetical protein